MKIDIDIQQKAIGIVKREKQEWEAATAFITDKVAFQMRNLIRQLRRNYWGIFEEPTDPQTGRKKIWAPLTETLVEAVVKNIDLDTKDINFRAKNPNAISFTGLVRAIVKNFLDKIYFGETLDEMERQLAIDGTAVWKTLEVYDEETKKKTLKIVPVDLLNVYIDPTSRSIQEAYRFTERALLGQDEVKSMDGWINTEDIEGTFGLSRTDESLSGTGQISGDSGTKLVDVWEMWGKMPKSLITGKKSDEAEEVEGHIVCSGLESAGKERVHLIEINKDNKKPYEEAWYTRVSGRWYGKGIAEKVMMLQLYLNIIVNIRINRSYVAQLGIFKIKEGRGITPAMLSRLAANGAIVVKEQDDIEQFVMKEASEASYRDEEGIQTWAERLTSAFEVVTGEKMPASTTATAIATQTRTAQSQFVLIKKGIGMFLQRWVKRHALPIIMKNIKKEDIIRITGDFEELRDMDERIVNELLYRKIGELNERGVNVGIEEIEMERQNMIEKLSKMDKDRYVKLINDIDFTEYDVQVFVTNEEVDKGVLVKDLISVLQTIVNVPQSNIDPAVIVRQIMDTMGLNVNQFQLKQAVGQLAGQAPQQINQSPRSEERRVGKECRSRWSPYH